jgi:hypothetical protein
MTFSKLRLGGDNMVIIEVRDCYGKEIERWKVMQIDICNTLRILNDKLGWNLIIKRKEEISDLGWAI